MELFQAIANELRRPGATSAGQVRCDGGLAAWHQISQLLLSEPALDQIRGDFLGIHNHTISRSCLLRQHQRDRDLYYIRDMNTLAERLTWAREQKGYTQDALAKKAGVSQSTIGNLESGLRLTARKILDIANAVDVDPMWLANGQGSPTGSASKPESQLSLVASNDPTKDFPFPTGAPRINVGDEPDTIPVRRVELKLQAGFTGYDTIPEHDDGGVLHVPRSVIEEHDLVPHQLLAIRVKGRSMRPMLYEGDTVVIDTRLAARQPVSGEVYALNWNGESCVKQLFYKRGEWFLYSANPEFDPVNVRSGHCDLIGKVVYQPGRVLVGRS